MSHLNFGSRPGFLGHAHRLLTPSTYAAVFASTVLMGSLPAAWAQTDAPESGSDHQIETLPLPTLTPDPAPSRPVFAPPSAPGEDIRNLLLEPQRPDFETYRLGPGDSFFVNVQRFPDLSFQATLDLQGNVVVPLHGVANFSGLTLAEAEALIAQLYDQYVVNPNVSTTLVAQRGVEVTVVGEVVRPGYYPLGAPQVSVALLSAGGTTEYADLRKVTVQRRLPSGEVLENVVDLFTPLNEGDAIPDIALQDGDVIFVERLDPSALDEYDRDLVARSTIARPTIRVRVLNYSGTIRGGGASGFAAIELPNGSRFADALTGFGLNPDSARLNQIALVRFDEEAGRAVTTLLNGNDAFRGDPTQNPPLAHNDVIVVERNLISRITFGLNTVTQPFRDVLGFLLFFDQLSESATNLFRP